MLRYFRRDRINKELNESIIKVFEDKNINTKEKKEIKKIMKKIFHKSFQHIYNKIKNKQRIDYTEIKKAIRGKLIHVRLILVLQIMEIYFILMCLFKEIAEKFNNVKIDKSLPFRINPLSPVFSCFFTSLVILSVSICLFIIYIKIKDSLDSEFSINFIVTYKTLLKEIEENKNEHENLD